MTSAPLLSGITAREDAEFRIAYPLNCEPLAIDNKLSRGQLRMTAGCISRGEGPGIDRGGINWNGALYRVMGSKLVSISAQNLVTILGDVGTDDQPVTLDYSFDRLIIRSATNLFYYDGMTVQQVTDEDLRQVLDVMWVDGYTMTTDGTYVIVTELSDPFSVLPLKYGSAEEDPDPITGLTKVRDEPYIIGRHTIQVLRNVGGNGFPFQVQEGATIPYGCVSASAKCLFAATFAFVGSARNEGLRVFLAGQGDATPISTRTVEQAIAAVGDPSIIRLEARTWNGEQRLFVHLQTESWAYCLEASAKVQEAVWYRLGSGLDDPYRMRSAVLAYDRMIVGDVSSAAFGDLSDDVSAHFGEKAQWLFDCGLIEGPGILKSIELKGLPGRGEESATLFMSLTRDGETYSTEKMLRAYRGNRRTRLQWRTGARFSTFIGIRFRGYDKAMPGFAKCEYIAEPLAI